MWFSETIVSIEQNRLEFFTFIGALAGCLNRSSCCEFLIWFPRHGCVDYLKVSSSSELGMVFPHAHNTSP